MIELTRFTRSGWRSLFGSGSSLIIGGWGISGLYDKVNGHSIFDVVRGQGLVVLHDLAGKDQAELLQGSVAELGRDPLLELKQRKTIFKYFDGRVCFSSEQCRPELN